MRHWSVVQIVPRLSKPGTGDGLNHIKGVDDGVKDQVIVDTRLLFSVCTEIYYFGCRGRYPTGDSTVDVHAQMELSVFNLNVSAGACATIFNLENRLAAIGVWDLLPRSCDFDKRSRLPLADRACAVFAGQRAGMRVTPNFEIQIFCAQLLKITSKKY